VTILLKKLTAAAIQSAFVFFAPNSDNWVWVAPWMLMIYGFLLADIEQTGRLYPYTKRFSNKPLTNNWLRFFFVYFLWQILMGLENMNE